MNIGPALKKVRICKRYTQEDIAEVLQITQQQYSRYELGIHDIPVRYVIALSKFYNVSADLLLGLQEE